MYYVPKLGIMTTTSFPALSGRRQTLTAASTIAPAETPTGKPMSQSLTAITEASSEWTATTSSINEDCLKNTLPSQPRVNAFVRRQNSACDPELIPILTGMEGKKRGAYQPSAKRKRRRINTVQNSAVQEAEEDGHLLVKDTKANRTYLIKEGWKDVYLVCAHGVPPDSWKEDLTEDI